MLREAPRFEVVMATMLDRVFVAQQEAAPPTPVEGCGADKPQDVRVTGESGQPVPPRRMRPNYVARSLGAYHKQEHDYRPACEAPMSGYRCVPVNEGDEG